MEYGSLPIDIQIKVDHLISYHGHKYPLSWYESKSTRELIGMHDGYLKKVSIDIEKLFT